MGKLTTKNLAPRILEFVNNDSFKMKAEQIARQMKKENFILTIIPIKEDFYNSIIEK